MIYQSEYVFQTKQKIKKTKKKNKKTVTINFNNEKATCKIDNVYIVLALFNYYIFVDNR